MPDGEAMGAGWKVWNRKGSLGIRDRKIKVIKDMDVPYHEGVLVAGDSHEAGLPHDFLNTFGLR